MSQSVSKGISLEKMAIEGRVLLVILAVALLPAPSCKTYHSRTNFRGLIAQRAVHARITTIPDVPSYVALFNVAQTTQDRNCRVEHSQQAASIAANQLFVALGGLAVTATQPFVTGARYFKLFMKCFNFLSMAHVSNRECAHLASLDGLGQIAMSAPLVLVVSMVDARIPTNATATQVW